jgi:hypothetical protein
MQNVSKFVVLQSAYLCMNILEGKVVALLMVCKSTNKWNFANLNKYQNSEILMILAPFLDLRNCIRKISKKACKVSQQFSSRAGWINLRGKSCGTYSGTFLRFAIFLF